jgi:UDP-GlcNAc:undecaprenyl-phosphate GlcNAc-1-phosphate transferase
VTWIALGGLLLFLPPGSLLFLLLLGTLAALVPYLVVNLELVRCRCKVFLGDAGSLLLGYLIVWGLIEAGRSPADLAPVTALWLVALPLMDTLAVMGRRLSNGRHPFAADRGHLHHCLARLLHSTRRALIILLALALLLAGIGVAGQVLGVAEAVMFYLALACFGGYLAMLYRWPAWHRRRLKQERAAATLRCGGR